MNFRTWGVGIMAMNNEGISIRIFLSNGSADGVWVVERSNWNGVALMSPRSQYQELRERPELQGAGVYLLAGMSEDESKPEIYIGETDNLRKRLDDHQRKYEFWTKVIVFTTQNLNMNKAHVRFLESRLVTLAESANRCELRNKTQPNLQTFSVAEEAEMESFLRDMLLIYPVLGIHAFENLHSNQAESGQVPLFLSGKGCKAEGFESSDGFVVLKGSIARATNTASLSSTGLNFRQKLLTQGILKKTDEGLSFQDDFMFGSPSTAAMVLKGRYANGRRAWKDKNGVTLSQLQENALDNDGGE